jgi:membrane peptidoglycan carboxypeptidase
MYFNEIPYGGATYGIEEAAQRFFGKSAKELTLAEGALLAGLPAAPTAYSPFGPSPELAAERKREVLRRMVEDEYISQPQADQALAEELHFRTDSIDIRAPHFVMYVKDLLVQEYGEQVLTQGGLSVKTTLDLNVQNVAQAAVAEEVESLASLRVQNGAALVTDPRTGEILAMVGSKDYFDFEHDGQVNVTLRPRQPGSSIKPLTYATAMERGLLTPSSIIQDTPITYQTVGSPPYSPKNYDGQYHGNVTVREALASSYNIPAVKTLARLGVPTLLNKAEQLGITTWTDRNRFGLSLTLGGGEVLMKDMAQLYSAFANYGYPVEPSAILEITNYKGETLYRNSCALDLNNCFDQRSLDPRVAYQITDILKDNRARTPAFGPQSVLVIPGQEVAVKTGTTNSLRDNWTIGYTSERLVAVWVGNNDNTSMSYVASGITGASPIWNQIMRVLLSEHNPHVFPDPAGLKRVEICKTTGTLPCAGCPWVETEFFIPGTEPTQACRPEQFRSPDPQSNDPSSAQPAAPSRDRILQGISF